MKFSIAENYLVQIGKEGKQIELRNRRISGMRALTPHIEAASKTRVLIGIDQSHSLDDPKYNGVEDFSDLTDAVHVLNLVELLVPSRLLTRHLSRSDIELPKSEAFDVPVNSINRCAPT